MLEVFNRDAFVYLDDSDGYRSGLRRLREIVENGTEYARVRESTVITKAALERYFLGSAEEDNRRRRQRRRQRRRRFMRTKLRAEMTSAQRVLVFSCDGRGSKGGKEGQSAQEAAATLARRLHAWAKERGVKVEVRSLISPLSGPPTPLLLHPGGTAMSPEEAEKTAVVFVSRRVGKRGREEGDEEELDACHARWMAAATQSSDKWRRNYLPRAIPSDLIFNIDSGSGGVGGEDRIDEIAALVRLPLGERGEGREEQAKQQRRQKQQQQQQQQQQQALQPWLPVDRRRTSQRVSSTKNARCLASFINPSLGLVSFDAAAAAERTSPRHPHLLPRDDQLLFFKESTLLHAWMLQEEEQKRGGEKPEETLPLLRTLDPQGCRIASRLYAPLARSTALVCVDAEDGSWSSG